MKKTIVSEYVSNGHPDKIADQISDAILDSFISIDKNTKAGIEVLIKDNVVVVGGEIKSKAESVNIDKIVRNVMGTFNFSNEHKLSPSEIKVINLIGKQSPEINGGVEQTDGVIGAGDQGFMFGYASNDTEDYLPLGVHISKKLCKFISKLTIDNENVGPDTKTQVIVDYDGDDIQIKSILVSTMHSEKILIEDLRSTISDIILKNFFGLENSLFEKHIKGKNIQIDINPCGTWNIGGPVSDCGLTGRKIVVDQFGGYCKVGGGAFSGKDGSKVDRSAAYMCRYLAKNIVASGICNTCEVSISYMIGIPTPCSIDIVTDNEVNTKKLVEIISNKVDLTPKGIINRFKLDQPIFYKTAKVGHYGDESYPWEQIDLVEQIKLEYGKKWF